MFTPAPFEKGKAKLVAFRKTPILPKYTGWTEFHGANSWVIDALWFSRSPSTLGSLVLGEIVYTVGYELVKTRDFTMEYDMFLNVARDHKNGPTRHHNQQVRFDSRIVLSETKIWGAGGEGELKKTMEAITLLERLDDLPEEWDGWYSFSNRQR